MRGHVGDASVSQPTLSRLNALVEFDAEAIALLTRAFAAFRTLPARGELLREGKPIEGTMIILSGWAARIRQLKDGRRQIMSFLLPGDLIGNCPHDMPVAVSSVVSLTPLHYCAAPPTKDSRALQQAFAISSAIEEAHLLNQITRLGRLTAEERIIDLFLELYERLSLCGLADHGQIVFPLTQEVLADATGLTQVHVNRTLQALRKQGDITLNTGSLTILDPGGLAERMGRAATSVTSLHLPITLT